MTTAFGIRATYLSYKWLIDELLSFCSSHVWPLDWCNSRHYICLFICLNSPILSINYFEFAMNTIQYRCLIRWDQFSNEYQSQTKYNICKTNIYSDSFDWCDCSDCYEDFALLKYDSVVRTEPIDLLLLDILVVGICWICRMCSTWELRGAEPRVGWG